MSGRPLRTDTFASPEVATFWRFIAGSLDHLVEVAGSLDREGLHWHPPASRSNSVAVLLRHTLANAEENVLGVLGARPWTEIGTMSLRLMS